MWFWFNNFISVFFQQQVITNEHVLDMVRNTLKEDGLGDQLKEAIFEPRLTRSMVKEAIRKGTVSIKQYYNQQNECRDLLTVINNQLVHTAAEFKC